MDDRIVDLAGDLVSPFETDRAYRFYDGARTVWLPKQFCEWDAEDRTMTMPYWLAEHEGLI